MIGRTAGLAAITFSLALLFACGKDSDPAAGKDKPASKQDKPAAGVEGKDKPASQQEKPAAKKELVVQYYSMPG